MAEARTRADAVPRPGAKGHVRAVGAQAGQRRGRAAALTQRARPARGAEGGGRLPARRVAVQQVGAHQHRRACARTPQELGHGSIA